MSFRMTFKVETTTIITAGLLCGGPRTELSVGIGTPVHPHTSWLCPCFLTLVWLFMCSCGLSIGTCPSIRLFPCLLTAHWPDSKVDLHKIHTWENFPRTITQ